MIRDPSWFAWVAAFPTLICWIGASAQTPLPVASPGPLPVGLRPHLVPVAGGRIDWTNGTIVADGIGRARGRTPRDRLMAQRAAELMAARNVVAAVADIPVSADDRIEGMEAGYLSIRGILRGQEILHSEWFPESNPPHARVTVSVPLAGALGVWPAAAASAAPATLPDAASPAVVILDARGITLAESLFPAVVDERGRVIWNSASANGRAIRIRYAEVLTQADSAPDQAAGTTHSDERSRPVGSHSHPSPRHLGDSRTTTLKVVRGEGTDRSQLVISPQDAAVLTRVTASAPAQPVQVVVLVDAVTSGR